MTDQPQSPNEPQPVPIETERRSIWDRASVVWAIPIIALAVALGAAWRNYNAQGPVIEVSFQQAAGITADETQLRFRDISVGTVESVRFGEDLEHVVVGIRVDKALAPYIDADARFWVVRPEVTAQGISGLDTVLSGVYIQGAWDDEPGGTAYRFEGLDTAPLLGANNEGIEFIISSDEGLPAAGTPVLYKGVEVGKVGGSSVNEDGSGVTAPIVIYDPHTAYITSSTRFWDISGFSFSLGAGGAKLNFTSLASLISGGVTFDTLGSGGAPLAEGMTFELFASEEAARDDFLVEGEGEAVSLAMIFPENLSGLSAGAPVELGGLRVGEVTSISGLVDRDRFGDGSVRLIASVRINPGRIGLGEEAGENDLLDYLETRIEEGLRARLTNASLLTGGLKVELALLPDAPPASLDRNRDPLPLIPTADADVTDVTATAQGVLQRVSALPIEEVMTSVTDFLNAATELVASPDLQAAPGEIRGILSSVRGVTDSDGVQGLPDQVAALFEELLSTVDGVSELIETLEEGGLAENVATTAENVATSSERLPALLEEVQAVIAQVQGLGLEALSSELSALLSDADALVSDTETQAIPGELRQLLASVREITESEAVQALPERVSGLVAELEETASGVTGLVAEIETQDTVARLTQAIDDVAAAADGLPGLVEDARAVVSEAAEVDLETLAERASTLLTSVDALVDQPSTRELPAELNGALTQLRETLEELRQGGIVENANAALASARQAADAVANATSVLPRLAADLRQVAAQAGTTLTAYNADSQFSRSTREAIRQVEAAASAIERLARQLERNPNSLILGR
ncbi:MlaD family protein [Litorisediminicola beolgyonensis]|uniref:MlaD family protein n=1 Tax=Litorisediminicola beolgyonensis TaxID=1173614 RepID=A0ABW3ZGD0_9RHOB